MRTQPGRPTRDAVLLARMLLAGLIPEAYAKPRPQREALTLVRHRAVLVRQRTSPVNRIHAQLHQRQLALPRETLLRKRARGWLKTVAWPKLGSEQRVLVKTHLRLIDQLTPMIRALDRRIRAVAAGSPAVAVLATIPGIGPYRGLLLASELTPIVRFATPAHLVAYAGLAPRTRSSSGHTRHGAIPRGANRWVRGALVSAIPSHVRAAPDSPLSAYYGRLKERLGWRVARVAAGRKLGRVVYQMLKTGEGWRG